MTKVEEMLALIAESPKTLKQIQTTLNMKSGNVSGSLACLLKYNKITREKIERETASTGPKMQWCYKVVDTAEKSE